MARTIPQEKTPVSKIDIEKIIAQVNATAAMGSPGLHCRYQLPNGLGRFALITSAEIVRDRVGGEKLVIRGSHTRNLQEKCLLFEIPLARCVEHRKSSFLETSADNLVLKWPGSLSLGTLVTMPAATA